MDREALLLGRPVDWIEADPVVLDPIDLGVVEEDRLAPDDHLRLLRGNLAALYAALATVDE